MTQLEGSQRRDGPQRPLRMEWPKRRAASLLLPLLPSKTWCRRTHPGASNGTPLEVSLKKDGQMIPLAMMPAQGRVTCSRQAPKSPLRAHRPMPPTTSTPGTQIMGTELLHGLGRLATVFLWAKQDTSIPPRLPRALCRPLQVCPLPWRPLGRTRMPPNRANEMRIHCVLERPLFQRSQAAVPHRSLQTQ